MTITKDATWQQLEGRVGQLRGDLATAERKLREYAAASVAKQLGLVAGETVVVVGKDRFLYTRCDGRDWGPSPIYGRKFRKDGQPAKAEQYIYGNWQIERGEGQ